MHQKVYAFECKQIILWTGKNKNENASVVMNILLHFSWDDKNVLVRLGAKSFLVLIFLLIGWQLCRILMQAEANYFWHLSENYCLYPWV